MTVMLRPCSRRGHFYDTPIGRIEIIPGPEQSRPWWRGRIRWICAGCQSSHELPATGLEWRAANILGARIVYVPPTVKASMLDRLWAWINEPPT